MYTFGCSYGLGFLFLLERKCDNKFKNTNISFLVKILCLVVTCCNTWSLMTSRIRLSDFIFVYNILNVVQYLELSYFIFEIHFVFLLRHFCNKYILIMYSNIYSMKRLIPHVINHWRCIFCFFKCISFTEIFYSDTGRVYY